MRDRIFPRDLPRREWVHFKAEGFRGPVCGVVYGLGDTVTNGMPLGGVDTGCIDLETSGLLGYCTIFNSHVPRRGPINLPILGMTVCGRTWVFCDPKQVKQGSGWYQGGARLAPIPEAASPLSLASVQMPKEIHHWGHYPVADLEFDTDAPISVGMRAWSPFIPGDVVSSLIPGIVFEVHLRNESERAQHGTVAFSFPGPTVGEALTDRFDRREVKGEFRGVAVSTEAVSYALGVIGGEKARTGGELGGDGEAWGKIEAELPAAGASHPGASAAVGFSLEGGSRKVVRFVVAWHAPTWNSVGHNAAACAPEGYSGEPRTFTHMYARHFSSAEEAGELLGRTHESLLRRILAWQGVIYAEKKLPGWLRDSLVNVLHLITEDGLWAQAGKPLPEWVREEDGLFGMNESPRSCPQIECLPCSFYGSLPFVYFFRELELSTLRGYKGYQFEEGAPVWTWGGQTNRTPYLDFASPTRGYQFASNGVSLAGLVNQFLMCRGDEDRKLLREFYPMVKRCMVWTVNLRATPSYSIGERIISMPDANDHGENLRVRRFPTEWFEAVEPGWFGMTAHIGGLHLAQLRITERMAKEIGDEQFARQCEEWIKAGADAMEKRLWTGSYYLNFLDPETGQKSDLVFAYQLDGEWILAHHGLPAALPEDRVKTVLETIKRCNVALTRYGAVNYTNADGTVRVVKPEDYGPYSYFVSAGMMLAMTYMYHGQRDFGIELAHRIWHNFVCRQGYTWDLRCMMVGDTDSGEGTSDSDYYQAMMLWSLPAALEEKDLSAPCAPGGLVDRILKAASESKKKVRP
ncbi:MAG: GH116 family glycosyl hydrolase [Planctomycetota bacterium]